MLSLINRLVNDRPFMGQRIKAGSASMGVDRGGTWTRVLLASEKGRTLKTARVPTTDIKKLPPLMAGLARKWQLGALTPAVIATRGAMSKKWIKPFLMNALKGKLNITDVISDAQAAYEAAFGKGTGLLLIAGTGSVAFFRNKRGKFSKLGGTAPAGGDPGSGLWIGNLYIGTKGLRSRRGAAAYARSVIQKACRGDVLCMDIVYRAQNELLKLVRRYHKTSGSRKLPLALSGGLMENPYFRRSLIYRIRRDLAGATLKIQPLKTTPQAAAAKLARMARTTI